MRVLLLAPWMKLGHGVSEMVGCLAPELAALGIATSVGCLGNDDHYRGLDMHRVSGHPQDVAELATKVGATAVVALGSPFFEVLPHLGGQLRTIAYEAGDPTPDLFEGDAAERRAIVENKRVNVYPHVDAVAAISWFIASDIGWPAAKVIVLGIDNLPDLGCKPLAPPPAREHLRIGALTRLGVGEARYKGVSELISLKEQLDRLAVPATFELMGRGSPADAVAFRDRGFTVHLNATEEQRNAYLRDVDVFVSTSLWEGTNLPLVEAQAQGTPGLALDTGAHPEFTPLVFADLAGMAAQIGAYDRNRELLATHGRIGYHFVRARMTWSRAAQEVAELILDTPVSRSSPVPDTPGRRRRGATSLMRSLQYEGLRATVRKARRTLPGPGWRRGSF